MRSARLYRLGALCAALLLGTGLAAATASAAPAAATRPTAVRACDATPAKGHFTCYAMKRTDVPARTPAQLRAASTPPPGLAPADLLSAYKLTSAAATNGAGRRVYVVDAYNDPTIVHDLTAYRAQYGLPACPAPTCFQVLNQNGAASPLPATDPDPDHGWAGETALDVEMVSAICPKCAITLVSAKDASDNLFVAVHTAVSLGAKFVSMSWGGPEDGTETDYDRQYFNAHDVVFGAATGDDGYDTGASYPSTSPNVLAVGGTTLTTAATTRGWTEQAWDGAGSGCSGASSEAQPSYQRNITGPSSVCSTRAESDVSADADPDTGPAVYDTTGKNNGVLDNWTVIGGTSASTPMIVSTYALAGTPGPASSLVGQLYKNRAGLNDVVGGSNDPNHHCPSTRLCTGLAGWDGPTGLGTPNGLTAFTTTPNAAGTYLGAAPYRLLDTRIGTGAPKARLAGGHVLRLKVTGVDGIPATGVEAVAINVTVVLPLGTGYLTAYADGSATPPTASNLNYTAGQVVPNLVVVPVGPTGYVDLYASATTDVLADAVGFYLAGTPTVPGAFDPLTPTRILDTRTGTGTPITGGTSTALQVEGRGGVPAAGVSAVILNVTVDNPRGVGYLTVYPGDEAQPASSNVNYATGQTVPNLVVAPLDASGAVTVFTHATADVIVDVEGYYLSGTAVDAGAFTPVPPTRVLDTRNGTGGTTGRIAAGNYVQVVASARSAVPATGVSAVVLNATVDQPLATGYLTVFSDDDASVPTTSTVNFVRGQSSANLTFAPVSTKGGADVYASAATYGIADVSGYFRSP